jgi:tetratricopeptide (TPR) repeat protein
VFSWSCRQLSEEAAGLFRLLGIHPGPDISVRAAASLAGTGLVPASAAMRELAALHLVTEHRPGRYALHDLVRAYAAEEASAAIPASHRRAAIFRVLDHYLHTAMNADAMLSPFHHPIITLPPPREGIALEGFDGRQQAMQWFDAEHHVLLAVTALAAAAGFDAHAWQLPAAFIRYLDRHGHWHDWGEVQATAHAAAQRLGDMSAQACVVRTAGLLSMRLGSYQEARGHFREALTIYSDLGDEVGQARAHGDMASTYSIQDRYRDALAHSERALELSRSAGHPQVHAITLNKVGWHAAHLGDYEHALACCYQALALLRDLGNRYSQAFVWDSLGYIHHRLGHHAESIDCFYHAISLFSEIGNRYELAATLRNLADACHAAGQPAAARQALQQALTILIELHHPEAADLRARLRATGS